MPEEKDANTSDDKDVNTDTQSDQTDKNQSADSQKTEDQTIPKARLDEVIVERNKLRKKIETIEKANADIKKKALEEQGKFKELYETAESEKTALKESIDLADKKGAVLASVYSANARKPDTVMKLVDFTKVTIDENGAISGVEEEIERLKQSDPYLFGKEGETVPGTDNRIPGKTDGKIDLVAAMENLRTPEDFANARKLYKQQTGQDLD